MLGYNTPKYSSNQCITGEIIKYKIIWHSPGDSILDAAFFIFSKDILKESFSYRPNLIKPRNKAL